ncbi:UNVERIFIED_CONTAM: hypothetical protein FKN15_019190 [Acipenser sinensis]
MSFDLDDDSLQELYSWVDNMPLSRPKRNVTRDFSDGEAGLNSLQELYSWVDNMPLSRPKRNVTRDFSDGVLAAEIVNFHFPKLVEMHNYVPASSTQQKVDNWSQLNRKVFNRLSFSVPEDQIRKITQCSPGVVEQVLSTLREKIEQKHKTSKLPPQVRRC